MAKLFKPGSVKSNRNTMKPSICCKIKSTNKGIDQEKSYIIQGMLLVYISNTFSRSGLFLFFVGLWLSYFTILFYFEIYECTKWIHKFWLQMAINAASGLLRNVAMSNVDVEVGKEPVFSVPAIPRLFSWTLPPIFTHHAEHFGHP